LLDQLLTTIILGLIQGLTEWLPISSTAHLKLAETLFGLAVTPLFNLLLHLGTMSVIIFYFRQDVKNILLALWHADFRSENGMLLPRLAVATVPTAVIGLGYSVFLQDSLGTVPIIAATFLVGGTIVYSTKFAKEDIDGLSYKTVLLIGLAQGLAIFPGLSRSGVTISTALMIGLKREKAFKFSFLLSIPAIIGDFAFEAYSQRGILLASGINIISATAAVLVAAVVGYFSIKLVSKTVKSRKFHYFAFYTWSLGIALLTATWLLS